MRKAIVAAALAASFISSAALAASQTDTGAIKALSTKKHQLTLTDGKMFELPAKWKSAGYKVGDKVTVTYELKAGKMMATEISHAS